MVGAEDEAGFTLVEALVGALIAVSILCGFVYFVVSSNKTASAASIRTRQALVGEAVWEHVNATATWTKGTACATAPYVCEIPRAFYLPVLDALDVEHGDLAITVTARGSDIPVDDTGPGGVDRDGVVPDVYDIAVQVVHSAQQTRSRPVHIAGTFDPTKAGQAGSLHLQVCTMTPQIDERLHVTRCPEPKTYRMGPPSGDTATSDFEVVAWEGAGSMSAHPAYRHVREVIVAPFIAPAGTKIQVRHKGTGEVVDLDPTSVPGGFFATGLDPGTWTVKITRAGDSRANRGDTSSIRVAFGCLVGRPGPPPSDARCRSEPEQPLPA